MRADVGGEVDVAWFVEGAAKIAHLQHSLQQGGRIAGIGAQIAITQVGRGKQRRAAREVEDDVAVRGRTIAGRPEAQHVTGRRRRLRVVVDGQLEGAEVTFGCTDAALDHRKLAHPWWRDVGGRPDQDGNVEMVLEQVRGRDGAVVTAVDQDHAVAVEAHERHGDGRLGCGGDQRRDLRAGGFRILRPARGFADVDETNVGILADRREQGHLLRTRHGERRAAAHAPFGTSPAPGGTAGARR